MKISIMGSSVVRALRCVLEQDTLSSAKYWFNPGRPVLANVEGVKHQANKIPVCLWLKTRIPFSFF